MATYATAQDLMSYASDVTFDPAKIEDLLRRAEDDIDRLVNISIPVLVLSVSGDPTGGNFTVTFNGQTTGAIAFDATDDVLETAVNSLSNVGVGGIDVTGGPLPNETMQIRLASSLTDHNEAVNLSAAPAFTGGTTPAISLGWRRVDPGRIGLNDRIALRNAVCAQAEYRNEMGAKFFRRPQYASVSGPDFSTKGKLSYYAPMVRRELAKSSFSVTGARASSGVGSRPLGQEWVPPLWPGAVPAVYPNFRGS